MAQTLETAIAAVANAITEPDDPAMQFERLREAEAKMNQAFKEARQVIANGFYAQGKPWREVGEAMGGVSAQRAWQIARGE
ncbi:hypothetical protein ACIBBD_02120 [Streptomyces sp. NPDC051315]|uniref:hypothetical protein n=1 Tax=Streptomyces sp. NPDC051315 TaxID=3365650 RepID=UPI0037AC2924